MRDTDLARRVALASHELRAQLPPATLLPAIHRRLHRGNWKSASARPRWLSWAGWAGLSTVCVVFAVVFVVFSQVDETQDVAADEGFVTLVNNAVWVRAHAGTGRTWLVTTELPRSRLAALGLPYDPSRAGERMDAQFLMHSSGEVLAVRVNH